MSRSVLLWAPPATCAVRARAFRAFAGLALVSGLGNWLAVFVFHNFASVAIPKRLKKLDSPSSPALNPNVARNQHRWKRSVSDHARRVLEESAQGLKWAWETDKEYPKSFPINTHSAFAEIRSLLTKGSRDTSQIEQQTVPSPPPPPKRLSELVKERTIKAVYEHQNDGGYEDALELAASREMKGAIAWRKILHAVNAAYLISFYGLEFIPKPRVQFLHRNLLKIAEMVGMNDLTHVPRPS
jgi:hypothetical protein